MKYTNKFNLPPAFVKAVESHDYKRGDADYTITELLAPPQQLYLRRKHYDEIVEDVSDRHWALLGSAVHKVLEKAADINELVEERLYVCFDPDEFPPSVVLNSDTEITVSGQLDNLYLANGTLSDYKMSSVWGAILGRDDSNMLQLQIQGHLLDVNLYTVNEIQNIYIFRDWSQTNAERDSNYPQSPIQVVKYPKWEPEVIRKKIIELITIHKQFEPDNPIHFCTADERWHRGDKYALVKEGRKSALAVRGSESELLTWAAENPPKKGSPIVNPEGNTIPPFSVEFRPGVSMRCARYCNVADFCPQRKAQLERDNSIQHMSEGEADGQAESE